MTTKPKSKIASGRSDVVKTTDNATGNSKKSKSKKSSKNTTHHNNNFNNQFGSTISDAVMMANSNPNQVEKKKNVEVDGHGRLKGQKNLIPVKNENGELMGKINKHGIYFTTDEIKKLNRAVDQFYRKRKTIHTREVAVFLGYDINGKISGKKDPFLTDEFSKGLHQFKTKDSYDRLMAQVNEYNSASYIGDIVNDYKNRLVKTIANTGTLKDKELERVTKTISKMSQKDFALRFGQGYFDTLTDYYKNQVEEDEQKKLLEEKGIKPKKPSVGRAGNLKDLMAKLGEGENALEVDKENNAFAVAKRAMKAAQQKKQDKELKEQERKMKQWQAKYDKREEEFKRLIALNSGNDTPEVRELFFSDIMSQKPKF